MKPFNRIAIFAGGGTRFPIYVGMYAAMEELGLKPDLLIATCGAALATTIIQSFDTDQDRLAYIKSAEFYQFFQQQQLTNQRKLSRLPFFSVLKQLDKRKAHTIEDVFQRYLVELSTDLSGILPSLNKSWSLETPSIIVGSKLLFSVADVGNLRNKRKLYEKVLFCHTEVGRMITAEKLTVENTNFNESAVSPTVRIESELLPLAAARISMADMFYVPPVSYKKDFYAGGAIDLVPIELAKLLGNHIIAEKKQQYSSIEESLVRAVLGYSANERLLALNPVEGIQWVDTGNIKQGLKGAYIKKKVNWRKFEIEMKRTASLEEFQEQMQKQWDYGFDVIKKQLS